MRRAYHEWLWQKSCEKYSVFMAISGTSSDFAQRYNRVGADSENICMYWLPRKTMYKVFRINARSFR